MHEISNNIVCATSKGSDQPAHSLECSMSVKLKTEYLLEVLSLTGGCRGSSESTLAKMSNCWKSHAKAQLLCITAECMCMFGVFFVLIFCAVCVM